jgi:hypothetical protein
MNQEFDIQPAPLVCPRCDQEFEYIEGEVNYTCMKCGYSVDNLQAQFAYSRGYDAFFAGQHVYMQIPPNRRSRRAYAQQAEDATQLFTEAYSAIQEALQHNLGESQRKKAIEMMATIAVLFIQIEMISPLESNYWTTLMVEQTNQKELDDLNRKLEQPSSSIFGFWTRLNWRRRKNQLKKGLTRIEQKILLIEQNIAFVTPPRVRKSTSQRIGR